MNDETKRRMNALVKDINGIKKVASVISGAYKNTRADDALIQALINLPQGFVTKVATQVCVDLLPTPYFLGVSKILKDNNIVDCTETSKDVMKIEVQVVESEHPFEVQKNLNKWYEKNQDILIIGISQEKFDSKLCTSIFYRRT